MSIRNTRRAALASATALQGVEVSPAVAPVAPVVTPPALASDAQPMPNATPQEGANISKPSKRALELARDGITAALAGDKIVDGGQSMIAAAVVDYCLNSLKWKPVDAINTGAHDATIKGNALSAFRASCVALFVGERPPSEGKRTDSLSIKHEIAVKYAAFVRDQFHVTQGANLALCLIADGRTMRDYDHKLQRWNLHGAAYCEAGLVPADTKARYLMEKADSASDRVPCKATVDGAETTMRRDKSHYVKVASARHAILDYAVAVVARKEQRAPHHNAQSTPAKGYDAGKVTNGPASPPVAPSSPNAAPNALPPVATDAPIAPAIAAAGNSPTTTQPTHAPRDAGVIDNFVASMLSVRRATLAVCEAPDMAHLQPAALMRIGPSTIKGDGWQAWLDTVKICVAWHTLHTADTSKPGAQSSTPVVQTPTVVDGVVLSTPVKADKIDTSPTDATSDAPIAAVPDADAKPAKAKRAAKSRNKRAA